METPSKDVTWFTLITIITRILKIRSTVKIRVRKTDTIAFRVTIPTTLISLSRPSQRPLLRYKIDLDLMRRMTWNPFHHQQQIVRRLLTRKSMRLIREILFTNVTTVLMEWTRWRSREILQTILNVLQTYWLKVRESLSWWRRRRIMENIGEIKNLIKSWKFSWIFIFRISLSKNLSTSFQKFFKLQSSFTQLSFISLGSFSPFTAP